MRYDSKLLEILARIPSREWVGEVYRHMFANFSPDHENTSGARWNLPEVPAIYTSLTREVVLAEADYQISMQPRRPKARRTIYKIGVRLSSVLDISDDHTLEALGLTAATLAAMDPDRCQEIGSSVEHLGHDGLLIPSARARGRNLVIYPNRSVEALYKFEVINAEIIDPGTRW